MNDRENQPRFKWKPTLAIFVVAITTLIVVNYSLPFFLNNASQQVINKITVTNVTVTVNYQNGTIETKSNISSYVVYTTVFDIMNANFQITYKSYSNGYFITSINGANNGWTYEVNGYSPATACNLYQVENNSVIGWMQG